MLEMARQELPESSGTDAGQLRSSDFERWRVLTVMDAHCTVFLNLVCAALICGQSKPDFSGTWKLNAVESSFSDKRASAPDLLVWTYDTRPTT
jgi:hypothetical protein